MPDDPDADLWRPSRTVHPASCECAGEGLLPTRHDAGADGIAYTVWRRCPGTVRRIVDNPGPRLGWSEYVDRRPYWFTDPPDELDHDWSKRAARALARDPGATPVTKTNKLAGLVAHYLAEYRKRRAT